MNNTKNNEKEVKNLLNVLEQIAPPDKTTNDLELAVQYARTWAKAQIQYFSITSDGNEANATAAKTTTPKRPFLISSKENEENTPPAEMRTPRRLYKSRIPLRSAPAENDFNFQRSGSLKYRSTPKSIKAPRSSSTGRITNSGATHQSPALNFATPKPSGSRRVETFDFQRSGSLKFHSTPKSTRAPRSASLGRIPVSVTSHESSSVTTAQAQRGNETSNSQNLSKSRISVIEQSPFARYKSKSSRNKATSVVKPSLVTSTPNSSADYELRPSSSLHNEILKPVNEATDQSIQFAKSRNGKKVVKFAYSEEETEEITSSGVCGCASQLERSSTFAQDVKNVFADFRNLKEAVNNFSIAKFFK